MSNLIKDVPLAKELNQAGFVEGNFNRYANNLMLLKNHSGEDLDIKITMGSDIEEEAMAMRAIPGDPNMEGNFDLVNENPTKTYNEATNTVTFTLAADKMVDTLDQCKLHGRDFEDGDIGVLLDTGGPLGSFNSAGYSNDTSNYMGAQIGIGYMWDDNASVICNLTDQQITLPIVNENGDRTQFRLYKTFSKYNGFSPANCPGLNLDDNTITLGAMENLVTTSVECYHFGFENYQYIDENDSQSINLGVAFKLDGVEEVLDGVLVKALNDIGSGQHNEEFKALLLEKYPQYAEQLNEVLKDFYIYVSKSTRWLDGVEKPYITCSLYGTEVGEFIGWDEPDLSILPELSQVKLLICPEHEIQRVGDQPTLNLLKLTEPTLKDFLPEVHKDYYVYSINGPERPEPPQAM